ncbi:hypothetical protein [Actinoplanes lobatus]|uniref:Uncharacterized protein n=1 Tax=Actinoplanes lobatus TaxID=113568 RepID=A0A7W7HRE9_9ACTN|nr:hypothetical protein [Actinoplanes lobatus]MBB4755333.1 hypothetical protein [Actinoplanes lobatus]GIE46391.1 hypothetical protein Alo02nite_92890 [Actinoplanes lobatus]
MAAINENVIELIRALARGGVNDPDIADRMGLTPSRVRKVRKDNDIPAGEQRWLRGGESRG